MYLWLWASYTVKVWKQEGLRFKVFCFSEVFQRLHCYIWQYMKHSLLLLMLLPRLPTINTADIAIINSAIIMETIKYYKNYNYFCWHYYYYS